MESKDEAARRIAGAYGDPASRNLLLQPVDGHDAEELEAEAAEIRALAGEDFYLLAYRVLDWNRELSPWEAPPVFGKEPFGSGAEETLKALLELRGDGDRRCFLGGSSPCGRPAGPTPSPASPRPLPPCGFRAFRPTPGNGACAVAGST